MRNGLYCGPLGYSICYLKICMLFPSLLGGGRISCQITTTINFIKQNCYRIVEESISCFAFILQFECHSEDFENIPVPYNKCQIQSWVKHFLLGQQIHLLFCSNLLDIKQIYIFVLEFMVDDQWPSHIGDGSILKTHIFLYFLSKKHLCKWKVAVNTKDNYTIKGDNACLGTA